MAPLLSTALLRTQTDERLLRLAAGGHDRAFEAIVERYRRPLLRSVRRLLPDGRAEDVVQAAFVSAWSSLRGGAEVRDLRPWLYRIAHNGAVNVLKSAGEHHDELADTLDRAAGPELEVERRDDVRRALHGIAGLPSRQRAALLAVAVEGRSHTEVAAELGLSDGALRQLVHRARTSVRAVATLLTPPPVAAAAAASHAFGADQVAELAAGAGGAGVAAASLKTGAVLLTAGALVTGAPRVADVVSGGGRVPRAHRAPAAPRTHTTAIARVRSDPARAAAAAAVPSASPGTPRHGSGAAAGKNNGATGHPSQQGGGDHSDGGSGSRDGGDDHRASTTPVADRSGRDGSDSSRSESSRSGSDSGGSGADSSDSGSDSGSGSDDAVATASTPLPTPGSGSGDSGSSGGSDDLTTSGSSSGTSGLTSSRDDDVSMP